MKLESRINKLTDPEISLSRSAIMYSDYIIALIGTILSDYPVKRNNLLNTQIAVYDGYFDGGIIYRLPLPLGLSSGNG
ncbi:MAG: hypothetical protein ACUZ8I_14920 [Candidatus Scalindua sp.]